MKKHRIKCVSVRESNLANNDQNHRVAASDVDFDFGPAGNSGAFFCYPLLFGLRWGERIYVLDGNNVKPLPVQVDTLPRRWSKR